MKETQTPAPTNAPPEAESQAPAGESAACAHPYYPIVPGATWTYTVSGDLSGGFSFIDTVSKMREDGFTLSSQFSELLRTQEWACNPEGLVALQYAGGGSASLSTSGSTANFETISVTGVTLPASIQAGDQWVQSYEIQGTQTMPDGQSADSTGKVTYDFTAIGTESVSVPAGDFQAMRIDFSMLMEITVSVSAFTVPTTMTSEGSAWYTPGVGWVRSADSGMLFDQPFSETIELSSFSIPGQ